jgi:hypothetical protein
MVSTHAFSTIGRINPALVQFFPGCLSSPLTSIYPCGIISLYFFFRDPLSFCVGSFLFVPFLVAQLSRSL